MHDELVEVVVLDGDAVGSVFRPAPPEFVLVLEVVVELVAVLSPEPPEEPVVVCVVGGGCVAVGAEVVTSVVVV